MNMGMRTVTFHPGLYSLAVPDMEDRAIFNAKKSIRTLDRISEEYGVILAVENMPSMPFMLGHTAMEMSELVEGTNMPICFDIGHANTTGQIDDIIDSLGDRFVNIHIHDNDGTSDQHSTIGEGTIDFEHVLKKLGNYRGNYIIESRSLDSAVDSLDRLTSLLG